MDALFAVGVGIYSNDFLVPKQNKQDIEKLFNFFEFMDKLSGSQKNHLADFNALESLWLSEIPQKTITKDARQVILDLKEVAEKYELDSYLIDSYFKAKKYDFSKFQFATAEEFNNYAAGAYEFVALISSKVLGLKNVEDSCLASQAKASLHFNLLTNLENDTKNGRKYFHIIELRRFGLPDLSYKSAIKRPGAFREFIEAQVNNYFNLQKQARLSYKFLPYAARLKLKMTIDTNNWLMRQFQKNPFLVFEQNIAPNRLVKARFWLARLVGG
ncbi:squalene/phytoene synthase family protein [Candidatus Nomurabacteria bacterium]|nr:squalene/phytoene synthase family protein [Candidatus Nomurabacteria bacterium]